MKLERTLLVRLQASNVSMELAYNAEDKVHLLTTLK